MAGEKAEQQNSVSVIAGEHARVWPLKRQLGSFL